MKILLYLVQLLPQMESHSLPHMLIIPLIAETRRDVKEIETRTGVVVVAKGTETGTETGIGIVVNVIAPERQMTITTINHGGGSMNETTTTSIEAMISIPNLDYGTTMSIVLGIVIVKSAIGIGNPDQRGPETEGTEETETETEETETGETGIGETGIEETGIEETE